MNLRHLTDEALRADSKALIDGEREILLKHLFHIMEVHRRRVFSAWGYQNLFEYAEKELKLSRDQAYRRVAAMKILREFPELAAEIRSGALCLTNLAGAKNVFHKKSYTRTEKLKVIASVSGKSTRDAQKLFAQIAPEAIQRDRIRPVTGDKLEVKFTAPYALEGKLKELQGRYARRRELWKRFRPSQISFDDRGSALDLCKAPAKN